MKTRSTHLLPIFIAAAAIGLACLIHTLPKLSSAQGSRDESRFDFLQRLRWMSYDWRVRLADRFRTDQPDTLIGVFMDEESIKLAGRTRQAKPPWNRDRDLHAEAVRNLTALGARMISFDVLFDQAIPDDPKDAAFAQALAESGRVVLAATGYDPANPEEDTIFPHPMFESVAFSTASINSASDADGVLRRAKPYFAYDVCNPDIVGILNAFGYDSAALRPVGDGYELPHPEDSQKVMKFRKEADEWVMFLPEAGEWQAIDGSPVLEERLWNLGIVLAAAELGLNLAAAERRGDSLHLPGTNGVSRTIPLLRDGTFLIDWSVTYLDMLRSGHAKPIHAFFDDAEAQGRSDTNGIRDALVVIGSTAVGNNVNDTGPTPLGRATHLVTKHINVANAVIKSEFISKSSFMSELALIIFFGLIAAAATWRTRVFSAIGMVGLVAVAYLALAAWVYVENRYRLPIVMPIVGGLFLPHFSMIAYRVGFEQREQRRVKGVFSKVVSPSVVNELLQQEKLSLGGARREMTVFFADVRGFTQMTDDFQARAAEYVKKNGLSEEAAEAHFDESARETLRTVNLYLSTIADMVKKHDGTLDKYMGDCVMAFWGAPVADEKHALKCVQAAIDAQRAMYQLNLQRFAENKRREAENKAREERGEPPVSLLSLLSLGTGINTGVVTVGLMGSSQHIVNYTVFGREVNLASRLEGVSGRGRIIISEQTYAALQKHDPKLAATCVEQPAVNVKGIRESVKIFEVPWKQQEPKPATLSEPATKVEGTPA